MEAPYTFASLPKPLDGDRGQIYAAPVYGLRGARKRKRHEVAVGIDGEGVNIYNVEAQSLTTSYALPPQSYLCCSPCSVYCRSPKPTPAQRRTYIVLRDDVADKKRRLVCFTENASGPTVGKDGGLIPGAKTERKLHAGDIVSLDVVPPSGATSSGPVVVVSYGHGRVECVSDDLSSSYWEYEAGSMNTDTTSRDVVEHAVITDLETARKGLLAGREDIVALLDPTSLGRDAAVAHTLLCHIVQSQTRRYLRLYAVRAMSADPIQSQRAALQEVLSYELPAMKSGMPVTCDLHAATGKLLTLLDGRLITYDLTGTSPRVITVIGNTHRPIESFVRLSTTSVCTTWARRIAKYEIKYGSMQAWLQLPQGQNNSAKPGEKRKHEDGATESFHLVATYSDLGLVLGLSGTHLQLLQLTTDVKEAKRSKTSEPLLIDVLGKSDSFGPKGTDDRIRSANRTAKWIQWMRRVDDAAANDYPQELENLTAEALGLKRNAEFPTQQDASVPDFTQGGTLHEVPWNLDPASISVGLADHRKITYLLSRCFRVEGENDIDRVFVNIRSSLVLKMLALAGFLTTAYCQQAQQHQHRSRDSVTTTNGADCTLPPGSILAAISRFDSDFQLMHDMLMLPIHWEVEETVSALRLLIKSFDTQAKDRSAALALPAPRPQHPPGGEDMAMTDDTDAESHFELESMAAEKELDYALSFLSSGLELRSQTLRLILSRLRSFPRKSVTRAMRAIMSHKDLIFFIQVLRIELADGGWTSRYVDTAEGEEDGTHVAPWMDGAPEAIGPSDQAIQAIGELLNSAIDAIGTTGFLVGLSADSYSVQDLVSSLRTEVSAGLEGLYEIDVLATALRDLERYSLQASRSKQHPGNSTLLDGEGGSALPLGYRVERLPTGTRLHGKGAKKTKYLLGKERSMRVGKYSIDRIRI